MKKLFFSALLLFAVVGVYGQKKVLKSAEKAFKKESYDEAITLAQQAANDPETQDDPDVYILLGKSKMYQFKADMENTALAEEAIEYFDKASEKGGEKVEDDLRTPPIMNNNGQMLGGTDGYVYLQNLLNDKGNEFFNSDDYEGAFKYFKLSSAIDPENVVLDFYAGYAAYNAELYDEAIKFYSEVVTSDDKEFENLQFAYNGLIDMYMSQKEDYDNALKYTRLAKEDFPNEKLYRDFEIDILIRTNKLEEAISGLQATIDKGDANETTYYTKAYLLWNDKKYDEAVKDAEKALELKPDYADAMYVIGSVHFNQGVEILKAANELDDNAAYEAKKQEAFEKFKTAMPYFEKGSELKPEDVFMLNPLSTIYDQLGMDAKRDAVLDKIEKLEGGE